MWLLVVDREGEAIVLAALGDDAVTVDRLAALLALTELFYVTPSEHGRLDLRT